MTDDEKTVQLALANALGVLSCDRLEATLDDCRRLSLEGEKLSRIPIGEDDHEAIAMASSILHELDEANAALESRRDECRESKNRIARLLAGGPFDE